MRRVLYLHGFASSPLSRKGVAFDTYLSERGFDVTRLDLRLPNRNELRVSAMVAHVNAVLDAEPAEENILIGSSLGGLVAAHVATGRRDLASVVLMAPAFGFAERWRNSLGRERLMSWQAGEPLVVEDHAHGEPLRVDYGFYEDASSVDATPPNPPMRTLVLHGKNDDVVPIGGSRRFVSQTPSATLVELDDDHALTASIVVMLPLTLRFLDP